MAAKLLGVNPRVLWVGIPDEGAVAEAARRNDAEATSIVFVDTSGRGKRGVEELTTLQARVSTPGWVFTYNPTMGIEVTSVNFGRDLVAPEFEALVRRVRQIHLQQILEAHWKHCIFEATAQYHLVAPSGMHCDKFVRIANAIRDNQALDGMAFWAASELRGAAAVLCDTWSIAPIALRAMQFNGMNCPMTCLPEHPSQRAEVVKRALEGIAVPKAANPRLAFLVSVQSSGNATAAVQSGIGDSIWELNTTALYSLKGAPGGGLCQLQLEPRNAPSKDSCALCDGGSKPVHVDPSLYYPRDYLETPVQLAASENSDIRRFLDRYGEASLRMHADAAGTHWAYFVDIGSLATSNEFQEAATNLSRELTTSWGREPDAILQVGRDAWLVAERLGFAKAKTLMWMAERLDDELKASSSVLVVSALEITGKRLQVINSFLRERCGHLRYVGFVSGLFRPTSQETLDTLRSSIAARHAWAVFGPTAVAGRLVLPPAGSRDCPLCIEIGLLSLTPSRHEWGANRMQEITQEHPNPLPHGSSTTLGSQSPLGPAGTSPVGVAFAIGSMLQQQIRSKHSALAEVQVLSVRNLDRYSEDLIRALIIHCSVARDWGRRDRADRTEVFNHLRLSGSAALKTVLGYAAEKGIVDPERPHSTAGADGSPSDQRDPSESRKTWRFGVVVSVVISVLAIIGALVWSRALHK